MMHRAPLALVAIVSLMLPSCGIHFMRRAADSETALTAPPAGKALVNFHRPSNFGGGVQYPVFDREQLIGNTKGGMRFQYVCDPGEHVFIGSAQKGSAIQADLLAGKVYDVVVNIGIGWVTANITMEPITNDHEKRKELATWEAREDLWFFEDDAKSQKFARRRNAWAKETLADFLGGSHQDRLQKLAATDHR